MSKDNYLFARRLIKLIPMIRNCMIKNNASNKYDCFIFLKILQYILTNVVRI